VLAPPPPPSLTFLTLLLNASLAHSILQLRVAQATSGGSGGSKVGRIKQVRKNIARILTVINTKARDAFKAQVKQGGVVNPKMLRDKKTRAIRRALTPQEVSAQLIQRDTGLQNNQLTPEHLPTRTRFLNK